MPLKVGSHPQKAFKSPILLANKHLKSFNNRKMIVCAYTHTMLWFLAGRNELPNVSERAQS